MKLPLFPLFILLMSCQLNSTSAHKTKDYSDKIEKIKTFVKHTKYNKNTAFMIDYSLHSGLNRFFVVDLKTDAIIKKGLVCHGSCKGDNDSKYAKVFSNKNDSYCTSLGFALVEERAYSKWGKNYKYWLKGLEKTNDNMRNRVVVLHAWEGVPDDAIYPKNIATSFGCPTVSVKFLDHLDGILKIEKKILLYSFD
ncbi:MAG: murein L,D-transpeptidase catalytic domain family protein [Flavobacteriaceae bacterium]